MPWQGRKEDHHLHKLHRELYENNVKHAGDYNLLRTNYCQQRICANCYAGDLQRTEGCTITGSHKTNPAAQQHLLHRRKRKNSIKFCQPCRKLV